LFYSTAEKVECEISGYQAKKNATRIYYWDHSMDYRSFWKSAKYCREKLRTAGLSNVKIIEYPADGKTIYGDSRHPPFWEVYNAELKIIEPECEKKTLARYLDEPLSLVMFSGPTPKKGIEAELILFDNDIRDLSGVKGKIVFFSQTFTKYLHWSIYDILKAGALGFISDSGKLVDEPDAIIWHIGEGLFPPERKHFGFVLSPREGLNLTKLLNRMKKKGKKVKVFAKVETKLYRGTYATITGIIPGEKEPEKEFLVASHLYEPGAIDNAGGCGLMLEVARALNSLIKQEKLQRPRRTIRFLFTYEHHSMISYALENKEKLSNYVGSIYVDGVGGDPKASKGYQALRISKNPESQSSYTDILLEKIAKSYMSKKKPEYKIRVEPYVGNDVVYMADPMINVAMTSLLSGLFSAYHNSMDTPELLSTEYMKLHGTLLASFIYFIVNASYIEDLWLLGFITDEGKKELEQEKLKTLKKVFNSLKICTLTKKDLAENISEQLRKLKNKLLYRTDRIIQAQNSILKLLPQEFKLKMKKHLLKNKKEIKQYAQKQYNSSSKIILEYCQDSEIDKIPIRKKINTPEEKKLDSIIPLRIVPGTCFHDNWSPLPRYIFKKINLISSSTALFWVDGKKSLLDIARLVKHETGRILPLKELVEQFEILKNQGYLKLKHKIPIKEFQNEN
jgi:aminopeptidase-like protein